MSAKAKAKAKAVLVDAAEACVAAMKHADSANELEAFRNAAARAGDSFKHLAREYDSANDIRCDNRVDVAWELSQNIIDAWCDERQQQRKRKW